MSEDVLKTIVIAALVVAFAIWMAGFVVLIVFGHDLWAGVLIALTLYALTRPNHDWRDARA